MKCSPKYHPPSLLLHVLRDSWFPVKDIMETAISQDNPVLVIGAGNCGLAIASGLRKAEIPCILFERDAQEDFLNKSRDWGMLLHWGDEYLRKVLPDDLAARLLEATVDPHYDWNKNDAYPHLDADSGEIVRRVQMPVMTRVSRKRLRFFLSQNLDLDIRFMKRLRSISIEPAGRVRVVFEDGSHHSGACVVGSDGSKSRVRTFLCGDEGRLVDTGVTFINHVTKYKAEQAVYLRMLHPIVKLAFSNRGESGLIAVADASDKEHPENWTFQVYYGWKGPPYAADLDDPGIRLQFLKQRVSRFCEPWRTAVLSLKDDSIVPVDAGVQFTPSHWDNRDGRVTLAGDAAHAMLPQRGQGLNNTMKDASEIVDALTAVFTGKKPLSDAIATYEAEMIPRGALEVGLSYELAHKRVDARYEDDLVRLGLNKPESKV